MKVEDVGNGVKLVAENDHDRELIAKMWELHVRLAIAQSGESIIILPRWGEQPKKQIPPEQSVGEAEWEAGKAQQAAERAREEEEQRLRDQEEPPREEE